MRLAYAMLANGAEYVDGKLYLLGGDFDTLNASAVPLIYPLLVIVAKFWFDPGETLHPQLLRVVPLGPEGQILRPPFDMPLQPPRPDAPVPGSSICVHMFRVEFAELGSYSFRIEVN